MGLLIDVQPSAGVALVIGGGAVALRKVRSLVEAGFAVEVVAPVVRPEFAALGRDRDAARLRTRRRARPRARLRLRR
ncbi:MAG: NAD(P)-dependent oxidoreductase [Thermoflexaceae bacterium]|nr:NAD(P)-dependent oxidoreductase [Thermoflexaceae bacterium]